MSKQQTTDGYIMIFEELAIYRNGKAIDEKQALRNHSVQGLSWGYLGLGCSQSALAILCDFTFLRHFMVMF